MRLVKALCCAAVLTVMCASGARADQWDKKKIFATLLAVPNQRMEPSSKPIVLFSERAAGSPQAVKVWFYPGETIGNEFVYPKSQAMKIAKETHQRVLAMNDDTETSNTAGVIPVEMTSAGLGHFDENGEWQSDTDATIIKDAPMVMAKADPAPAPMMAKSPRRHLPRTSSSLALFELISGLSLAGGFSLRQLRKHAA